jgi:carbonic anhydrase/acetyltransferase-like protein (isoleucine patch superfamily)
MATVIAVGDKHPQLPAFLAPNATLVGDVRFGPECSVWFGAILRGDINHIELGAGCNVQDGCILHVSRALPCKLGNRISLGHGVIAHACTIHDGALIGMGARILDGATIGAGALVAAGCVVGEGVEVPAAHLIAGVPGRVIKPLDEPMRARIGAVAGNYIAYQRLYPQIMARS